MQKQWSNVDNYLIEKLIPKDDILEQVLVNNQQAGRPAFDVAANQGQLLALLFCPKKRTICINIDIHPQRGAGECEYVHH